MAVLLFSDRNLSIAWLSAVIQKLSGSEDLERQAFVYLIQQPKTQERILHMLTTGKPLRN
jgi:hypothetical protein